MVMFYDEYSSETFAATIRKYMTDKFVQSETAQICPITNWTNAQYPDTNDFDKPY